MDNYDNYRLLALAIIDQAVRDFISGYSTEESFYKFVHSDYFNCICDINGDLLYRNCIKRKEIYMKEKEKKRERREQKRKEREEQERLSRQFVDKERDNSGNQKANSGSEQEVGLV